jgi:tight adherence protein B
VRRRGAVVAVAAAAAACLAAVASGAGASGGFVVKHVALTTYPTVDVVVKGNGKRLPPLYENGARIRGLDAQNLGSSKAIVLAVDRSKSMSGTPLDRASAAAAAFVGRKPHSDLVSVVSFGSTALTQASLSQSTIDADNALRTMTPDSVEGTALYDAVVVASTQLAAQTYPGRVLILLTDGRNVRSLASLDDAVRSARRAGVVVDAIALGNANTAPLRTLTHETGGSLYMSATPASLDSIYRRIGAELDHTWRVSYTTNARPGDQIAVSVASPKAPAVSVVVPGRPAQPSSPWLSGVLYRGALSVLILLLVVGAFFYLSVREAGRLPRSAKIKRLVRTHTDPHQQRRERGKRPTLTTLLASLDRPLSGLRQWKRLESLVETAAVPLSATTLIAAGAAVGVLLAVVFGIAAQSALIAFVFLLAGIASPFVVVRLIAARRIRAFERQLPDVLTTIAGSLKVGHGLKAALQTVATEGAPPMSTELRRVLAEERLGRPLEDALVSMCERLGSEDLLYVATAVDVHSQVGGSVAGVFATVAETVRIRQQHRRRVQALSSMGRATAKVLAVMPVVFILLTSLVDPSYTLPFVRSTTGHLLLAYSAVSVVVGFAVLSRMVNVEE